MEYKKVNIPNYEDYQVDTNGIIYGKNGKPLHQSRNKHGKGYYIVQLRKDGVTKGFSVHTIVATTFLTKLDNQTQVNHIDGNKINNHVENLEWCTSSDNMTHAYNVLGVEPYNIMPINGYDKKTGELLFSFNSIAEAGRYFADRYDLQYRYCQNNIWRVLHKTRKTYKNCIWEYADDK